MAASAGISFRIHERNMHVLCANMCFLRPSIDACQKHAFWAMYFICFVFKALESNQQYTMSGAVPSTLFFFLSLKQAGMRDDPYSLTFFNKRTI